MINPFTEFEGKRQLLFETRYLLLEGDVATMKKGLREKVREYGSLNKYIDEVITRHKILEDLYKGYETPDKWFNWERFLKKADNREMARRAGIDKIYASRAGGTPDFSKGDGVKLLYRSELSDGNVVKFKNRHLDKAQSRELDNKEVWAKFQEHYGLSAQELKNVEKEYMWHHIDDFDPITGEYSLQLVKKNMAPEACTSCR